jgi:hypothetical protein
MTDKNYSGKKINFRIFSLKTCLVSTIFSSKTLKTHIFKNFISMHFFLSGNAWKNEKKKRSESETSFAISKFYKYLPQVKFCVKSLFFKTNGPKTVLKLRLVEIST